jgi:cell division septum initiation protein DivIVA
MRLTLGAQALGVIRCEAMSPDPPLDATGIARRQFSSARKGFDTGEVRAYLHEVADLVGRLQREGAHEHDRAERAETRATLAEQLDEHRLVELLGEETARVLEAARAASADIRSRAEDSAARMVREAHAQARGVVEQAEKEAAGRKLEILAEADALRREAEEEVERRRAEGRVIADELRRDAEVQRERMLAEAERARGEAEAAAEQIRAAAREQGRRLVGEAHAVRERMLADLARRRRSAREQLERLNGARERLLAAYQVVKRTVDEATTELTVALPEAKAAAESAMRRVSEEPEDTVEVLEAELSVARMSGLDDDLAGAAVSDEELDRMIRELAEEEAAQAAAAAEAQAAADVRAAAAAEAHAAAASRAPTAEQGADEAQAEGAAGDADAGANGTGTGGAAAEDTGATTEDPSPPRAGPSAGPRTPGEPRPQTDGERWGVRLPRSRQSAVASKRAPVAVAADEGEPDQHVDELFARIRAEGSGGDADAGSDPTEAGVESGAVAVAVRADAPDVRDVEARAGTVDPDTARADADADTGTDAPSHGATDAVADAAADDAADEVDAGADDEAEPLDPVTAALQGRDTQLAGVERELGRRLKRVLADEQNEVLDTLRRGGTVEFDDMVPAADEHADRFAIAATPDLDAAADHGATWVAAAVAGAGAGAGADAPTRAASRVPSCDELAGELGRELVDPLRHRIRRSFDDCDGDLEEVTERLRALYREWKGQHIGDAVRHFTVAAYARGAYHSAPDGATVEWLVDPSCVACPDCDDNALAGQVAKGEAFPTADTCAPAHTGCRCLVVPAAALQEPPAGG